LNLWLALVLSILAVYRISYSIVKEDGPFDLFVSFQDKIGQDSWIGRGFHCVLCLSFWLSFLPAFWLFWGRPINVVIGWFGIAGAIMILHSMLNEKLT
jgi:hypothetical protein